MPTGLAEWNTWRAARQRALSAPESWLGLVGLHWLEPGSNTLGSAADCALRLPSGPGLAGSIDWDGAAGLLWRSAPGAAVAVDGRHLPAGAALALSSDRLGAPTELALGALRCFLIERDGRLALRVKDLDWATRRPFLGVDCHHYDPAWAVDARWEALPAPRELVIPSMSGGMKTVSVTHRAVFAACGTELSLLPLEASESKVFFVFRDLTSGKGSYGGGRFLDAAPPQDGRIALDFNFACNPPCAFSPFATCPLPPPENRLPVPVIAGERSWTEGHSA